MTPTCDADGHICAVASSPEPGMTTMTGYLYDAGGTRVAKGTITSWSCDPATNGFQTTSDYVIGLGGEQRTEMSVTTATSNGAATTTLTWLHTNVWAGGKLLGTYDKDGLHFYFDDPLGTRRAQTDAAGVLEQSCVSLPYGDGLNCSGQPQSDGILYTASLSEPTENHFTGKERDTESGNDYFGARYYSSALGRFLSPDWSAKIEPVPYAKLDDPQSLNLYAYVGNNPMDRVDADGHEDKKATGEVRNIPAFSADTMKAFDQVNVCNYALKTADKDRGAVERADAAWDILQGAASAHDIPTSLLAAIGGKRNRLQGCAGEAEERETRARHGILPID